jgi:hypothetical protein
VAAACKDPAREEAMRLERDRRQLDAMVAAHVEIEKALMNVAEAEKAHDDDRAASLVETTVLPKTDSVIAMAKSADLGTTWGRGRRDDLLAAMQDQRDELPRFVAALRSHDLELKVATMVTQLKIESHAQDVAQSIWAGPNGQDAGR